MTLLSSCVYSWSLNNDSTDDTGNADSTGETDITYSSGVVDQAADFNGSSSLITLPKLSENIASISAWVKLDGALSSSTDYMIISQRNTNGFYFQIDHAGRTPAGALHVLDDDGTSSHSRSTALSWTPGEWYHVVFVKNGDGTATFYRDNVDVTGVNATRGGAYLDATGANGVIGRYSSIAAVYFKGAIDILTCFDVALTVGNVDDLFNSDAGLEYDFSGEPPVPPGPVDKSTGGGTFVQAWLLLVDSIISGAVRLITEMSNSSIINYLYPAPHVQITGDFRATVVKVHDGDTATLRSDFRNFDFPLRLANINAPEMNQGGSFARDWLRDRVLGKDVDVLINPDNRVGKYGRLIGELFVDGFNVNNEMMRQLIVMPFGYGVHRLEPVDKIFKRAEF